MIAGFLGFEEVEKFLDSFSFSDMFNEFLDDIYAWFNLLFSDPMAALGKVWSGLVGGAAGLIDLVVAPLKDAISWILGIFGFEEAAANVDNFSLSGMIGEAFDKVIAWFKGIFSWGKEAGATEEGGWSFLTFVGTVWQGVKDLSLIHI